MKSIQFLPVVFGLALAFWTPQAPEKLDAASLRKTIEGMGYTCQDLSTDPGKEKFQFSVDEGGFNIPIAAELSKSTNYIWLTVSLGPLPADPAAPLALLKENAKIQPDSFYVSNRDSANALMLGVAVDNRNASPDVFKRVIEKLSGDVSGTSTIWSKPDKPAGTTPR